MSILSTRQQCLIASILVFLIVATRGHHFESLNNLPGASWAVFFLAGVYLRSVIGFAALLVLTWILDYTAIVYGGVSSFCVTPAYVFLLPAYGSLWFAGRWYVHRYRFAWPSLLPLAGALLVGAVLCELFSGGGFYFFSGRYDAPSVSEFGQRLLVFFPSYLRSLFIYVAVAAVAHTLIVLAQGPQRATRTTGV